MSDVPNAKDVVWVPVEHIELDPENPRLPTSIEKTEDEILKYLADETSIHELMQAIGQNGFFAGEPIVVIKVGDDRYRVLEGNRRLASVMLLRDPNRIPRRASIIQAAHDAIHKPEQLPVVIFDRREEVVSYLGYRHITGVKAWDPVSKARYLYEIFQTHTDPNDSPETRYKVAARAIGSRANFVKRTLTGLALFNAIDQKNYFGIEELDDRSLAFSLLSTAASYENILIFLGADRDPVADPGQLDDGNVEKLTRWLFERGKDGKTKIGESRSLSRLAHVVANERALVEFSERGATLDQAWRITRAVADEFDQHLNSAIQELTTAFSLLPSIDPDEGRRQKAEEIWRYARQLRKNLSDDD